MPIRQHSDSQRLLDSALSVITGPFDAVANLLDSALRVVGSFPTRDKFLYELPFSVTLYRAMNAAFISPVMQDVLFFSLKPEYERRRRKRRKEPTLCKRALPLIYACF